MFSTVKHIQLMKNITFSDVLFEKTKGIEFNILDCLGLILWVCLWCLIYYSIKIILLLWPALPVPPHWLCDFSMCLMSQHCELWIQLWDWDIPGSICGKLPIRSHKVVWPGYRKVADAECKLYDKTRESPSPVKAMILTVVHVFPLFLGLVVSILIACILGVLIILAVTFWLLKKKG